MTILRNYFAIGYVLILTSFITGSVGVWIHTNRPEGADDGALGMHNIGWGSFVIFVVENLGYHFYTIASHPKLGPIRSYFQRDQGKVTGGFMFGDLFVNSIVMIIWGVTNREFAGKIQPHCDQFGQCVPMNICAAFGWLSLACIILRIAYLVLARIITYFMARHVGSLYTNTHMTPALPTTDKQDTGLALRMANVSSTLSGGQVIDKVCVQCRQAQCSPKSVFCGADCIAISKTSAPGLIEIPPVHYMFREISDSFKRGWPQLSTPPLTKRIFAVIMTEEQDRVYRIYREGIEIRRNFIAHGLESGNQQLLWHGTARECTIGDQGSEALCRSTTCPLCNIIRLSFDTNRFGSQSGRLGKGIYTSAAASKAHNSSKGPPGSQWKALLLNLVVVGNTYPTMADNQQLLHPPEGYDSVLGQSIPVENSETVVYRNDGIRPVFLVLYLPPSDLSV